jgi:hypothetical protein
MDSNGNNLWNKTTSDLANIKINSPSVSVNQSTVNNTTSSTPAQSSQENNNPSTCPLGFALLLIPVFFIAVLNLSKIK